MKKTFLIIIIIALISLLSYGCYKAPATEEDSTGEKLLELAAPDKESSEEGIINSSDGNIPLINPGGSYPEIDGLHVTGTPIEVDIDKYRLVITGEVENPLSFTFDEIKAMDSKRIYSVLNCPGFFSDRGYWTGVDLKDLLELAVLKDTAAVVDFISIDESYNISLSLENVLKSEGILVSYYFDDEEFPEIHGYPLRIVADGFQGSIWVKWLGKIEIRPSANGT